MTNLTIANENNVRRTRLSNTDFIRLWQTSNSVDEFCESTAEHRNGEPMKKQSAYSRSRSLREQGIPLKTFSRAQSTDFAALAELAASFLSEEELQNTKEQMAKRAAAAQ
jgi:hypothetical protein